MTTQVIIKYATQNTEDFNISCEMVWTIAQLKDKLSALHPMKPKREHQKLIYGGKLLPDHLQLKSVLNQSQDIHIIHLVCPPPAVSEKKKMKETKPSVSATPTPSTINPTSVYPQSNPHLLGSSSLTNSGMPAHAWSSPTDMNQQYIAAQQMYMQMMSQYYAQLSGTVPYGPIVPPMVQQTLPEANAPANPQPWQNEEEHDRDYIDYLYSFTRIVVMAMVLLYYSTASRVFHCIVMLLFTVILHKINRHRDRAEQLLRARQTSEQVPLEQNPDTSPDTGDEQATEETSSQAESVPPTSDPPVAPPTPSVPSTIFTLVTAFFTSLVPEDPMPVNVN